VKTKKVGPMGRFGARGGATVRKRRGEIEILMKKLHECPRCLSKSVKRVSVGVWRCRKCGHTFAGGAYVPTTKLGEIARRAKGLAPSAQS
jgi:large subunit ribosomal protein L37Ae